MNEKIWVKVTGGLLGLFYSIVPLYAAVEDHFKKAEGKGEIHRMGNIDFIYTINLDQRPEKFTKCIEQFLPYDIHPYRFSAVNGWELSLETINDVGVKFIPGMTGGFWGTSYDSVSEPTNSIIDTYGKIYFCHCMSQGAIGIVLSHLSVLQDAYDAGYETIWVMEDDVFVKENPHQLGDLIEKLDALVGDWDILYTDDDGFGDEIPGPIWWAWRPDMPIDSSLFGKRTKIDKDFMKIKSRTCTYSMIIRRSGMRKILEFIKQHHIFLPYDHDFSFIEEIQLYMLNFPVVAYRKGESSDVQPFSPL